MSVLDASVLVDALVLAGERGAPARAELRAASTLEVPAIFRAEAVSALRGLVLRGRLSAARGAAAREQVGRVRARAHPFEPFLDRAWELRENLTVYDAWYVALAERLATELVTVDVRLASAAGPRCPIRVVGG